MASMRCCLLSGDEFASKVMVVSSDREDMPSAACLSRFSWSMSASDTFGLPT